MGLKLPGGWKKWVKLGVLVLIIVLVAAFFIRLVTWEDSYYREMEGSERYTVDGETTARANEELIEEEPTEEEIYEYVVAPERPRYLTVDALGIYDSRVLPVGINSDGQLGTPRNIFDVGWYDSSGLPGEGRTILIDGHNGGPHMHGVFKNLPDLEIGSYIEIERGDGTIFYYSVVENVTVGLDESDVYMATAMRSPEAGKESLSLISCTGDWSSERNTYLSRQFVRAILVDEKAPTE